MKIQEEQQIEISDSYNAITSTNLKANTTKIVDEELVNTKEISNKENNQIQNNIIQYSNIKYFKNNNFKKTDNKRKNILPKINFNNNNNSHLTENNEQIIKDSNNLSNDSKSFYKGKYISNNEPVISNQNESIKRKTINRGQEIKNVQITHIICSSKPSKFHITEKLYTENIKSEAIRPSNTFRERPLHPGKSSFSSSCQDNIKHKIKNLKGKTIIYQHARGIGMTNDSKKNINPLFYNSEIKKLDPIFKEKEKEKVEYIENFRSSKIKNDDKIDSKNIKTKYDDDNNNNQYQIILILLIIFSLIKLL
jgi:hypothetical protein